MACRTSISVAVRSMRSSFGGRSARMWLAIVATILLTMTVASADRVQLEDGDVLRGTVVEQTDAKIVLEHNVLGRLEIPRGQIKDLDIEEKKDVKWDSHVNLAFNGAAGNTEESSLRIGARSRRRAPGTRLRLDAAYHISTSESIIDNNKLTVGIENDWLLRESRWFVFADGRFEYDQLESWRQLLASHVGPGYDIIDKDGFHLDARGGVGPRKEWGSEDDDWEPEGLFGLRFDWEITRRQSFDASAAFLPVLADFGNYRTRSAAHWAVRIFNDLDLSVTAGATHEYQSEIDPGKDHNDLRFFTGLQFDF